MVSSSRLRRKGASLNSISFLFSNASSSLLSDSGLLQAAVDSLTRSLALEFGTDYSIRCNGVAPGPISDTPGMNKLNPAEVGKSTEFVPLGRMGEKWDIAMAAIFLAAETGKLTSCRLRSMTHTYLS